MWALPEEGMDIKYGRFNFLVSYGYNNTSACRLATPERWIRGINSRIRVMPCTSDLLSQPILFTGIGIRSLLVPWFNRKLPSLRLNSVNINCNYFSGHRLFYKAVCSNFVENRNTKLHPVNEPRFG